MDENRPMTKRELKAARRAERTASYSAESKQNMVKWAVIGIVSIIFLGLFGSLIFFAKQNNPITSDKPAEISAATGWTKTSGASESAGLEDATAKVTLVEYGDLQCPACKAYYPVIAELVKGYNPDQLKFTFKHFPLTSIHPNAMAAHKAAEAAGAQGKFFEFHDLLYQMQESWSGLPAIDAEAKFVEFAEELGLDMEKFNADRSSAEVENIIRAQMDEGVAAGATGTPSFFINGQKIANPQSIEDFRKLIDEELK